MRAEMLRATALSSRSSLQQERLFERERKTGLDHRLKDTKVITKYGSGFTKMMDRETLIMNNAGTFKILTFAHILNLHEHLDNHLLLSV